MKKSLFLGIMLMLFLSCGNKAENKKITGSEKAEEFYERARQIDPTIGKDAILKAITLLDSAIMLDDKHVNSYILKQSYQSMLGEYKDALNTIEIIEKLDPNADMKSAAGILYLMNNDKVSAEIKLSEADSIWNIALDTINPNNNRGLLHILMNKGIVLKLLGKEAEANNTFNRILTDTIFNKEEYTGIKNDISSLFINQSGEEILDHLLKEMKSNTLTGNY